MFKMILVILSGVTGWKNKYIKFDFEGW